MMGTHDKEGGLILWVSWHGVGSGLGCPMVGMDLGISSGCGLCAVGINGGLPEIF